MARAAGVRGPKTGDGSVDTGGSRHSSGPPRGHRESREIARPRRSSGHTHATVSAAVSDNPDHRSHRTCPSTDVTSRLETMYNMSTTTNGATMMKGTIQTGFGDPVEVLRIGDVERPAVADDGVLVRVRAASIHIGAVYGVKGFPKVMRPMFRSFIAKSGVIGQNVAGIVEAVGPDVRHVAVGDEVFGSCRGAFAEYAATTSEAVAPKPTSLTFEQASALGVSAFTALQALRDHGELRDGSACPGHRGFRGCRHLRRPDRQGDGGGGHRGVQHPEPRPGSVHRCRPRHRLHATGLHHGRTRSTTSSWTTSEPTR